ncbi:Regulatory protein BlaR1 [Rubripirellula lacrimiformis]|uniref:Regulatory protein BlaR1 n=1 Tax=Rubripirellula lacrimiformis TaxID=1930273 RepID=A0A517NL80_9BACT|nr:M56 family metallopeptidase [Rubripirellula lacrimiformis]QDT07881.1 Regulatory protein BlaR1 [Rubripirellula lacrimiformis]
MSTLLSSDCIELLWLSTWQSAILAAVVWGIIRSAGRWLAPSWRVVLWMIPLVRMVVLVLPWSGISLFQGIADSDRYGWTMAKVTPQQMIAPEMADAPLGSGFPSDTGWAPGDQGNMQGFQDFENSPVVIASKTDVAAATPPAASSDSAWSQVRWSGVATVIWMTGVMIVFTRCLIARIQLARLLRRCDATVPARIQAMIDCRGALPGLWGRRRTVRCLISDGFVSDGSVSDGSVSDGEIGPATFGLFRPCIIIPRRIVESHPAADLQLIVDHEWMHIRRWDAAWMGLATVATTVAWFNPIAYWLRRQLRLGIEMAVDAAMIERIGEKRSRDYGQLLVQLAGSGTSVRSGAALMLPMAVEGSGLRQRVEAVMAFSKPRRWQSVIAALVACLLILSGLSDVRQPQAAEDQVAAAPQQAAEETLPQNDGITRDASAPASADAASDVAAKDESGNRDGSETAMVYQASGRVVDADGNPVAGAKLYSSVYREGLPPSTPMAKSDDRGEYTIAFPQGLPYEGYFVWCYSPDHSIRVVRMAALFRDQNSKVVKNAEIRLPRMESVDFNVFLPDGKPAEGMTVSPLFFAVPSGVYESDERAAANEYFPDELARELAARTDDQGRATIRSIQRRLNGGMRVKSDGFGQQDFLGVPSDLKLAAVGRVEGAIEADAPLRFHGQELWIGSDPRLNNGAKNTLVGTDRKPRSQVRVKLDADGRFVIPEMIEGQLVLHSTSGSVAQYQLMVHGQPRVIAGQTTQVVVDVLPTVSLTGKVLAADTRQPVVGASINVMLPARGRYYTYQTVVGADVNIVLPHAGRHFIRKVHTDKDGRYSLRFPRGEIRQVMGYLGSLNDAFYDCPVLDSISIPEGVNAFDAGIIEVHPQRVVRGRLLDADGRPIENAKIVIPNGAHHQAGDRATTAPDGSFEMPVRDFDMRRRFKNLDGKWALETRPAVGEEAPQYTMLNVVLYDPDAMVLQTPDDTLPQNDGITRDASAPASADAASDVAAKDESGNRDGSETAMVYQASGRVVDADGNPVAGAKLYSSVYREGLPPSTPMAKSDDRGEYTIAFPQGGSHEDYFVWCYSPQHSIRVVRMAALFRDQNSKVVKNAEIRLPRMESVDFNVFLPDGKPAEGMVVRPKYFDVPNGVYEADERTGLTHPFPDELASELAVRTDDRGRARMASIPPALQKSMLVESPDFGVQDFGSRDTDFRLSAVGRVEGVIEGDNLQQFAGRELWITSDTRLIDGERITLKNGVSRPRGQVKVKVDVDGRFAITNLAEGKLVMASASQSDAPYQLMMRGLPSVVAGQTTEVVVDALPTVPVTGQILAADTRQPVVGATIVISPVLRRDFTCRADTDDQGRYSLRVPRGEFRSHVMSLGPNQSALYESPESQQLTIPDDAESFDAGIMEVHRKRILRGRLVDAEGQPIATAQIVVLSGVRGRAFGIATTSIDGSFEMQVWRFVMLRNALNPDCKWGLVTQPVVRGEAPQYTMLNVVVNDPDAMVLRTP